MSTITRNTTSPQQPGKVITYPQSDGKPMADNTKQLRWIVMLYGNLAALFRSVRDVFVGANQFWYPREGYEEVPQAPDVYVVFGRPKGDRPSYKQWEEDDVPITVAFEILSPGNDNFEMEEKRLFYEEYGVEEYYVYDPDRNRLLIYLRKGDVFRRVRPVDGFVSPRMGIRFVMAEPEMIVQRPDGAPFRTFEDHEALQEREHQLRVVAEQRADSAERRAARLTELMRKSRNQQATADELAELERLLVEE